MTAADDTKPPTLDAVVAYGLERMRKALGDGDVRLALRLAVMLLPFENEPVESKSER